jgi:imidazolonepropionase-like amidohydrolase
MRKLVISLVGALSVLGCETVDATLAITNVTVIDVEDGSVRPGQTILIDDDRIVQVGTEDRIRIPAGAEQVDGQGQFAIPGLWDMHIHMVNDVAEPVPWDFHRAAPEDADQRDIYMPIYLAFGVTSVREMSGGLASLELRDRVLSGDLLGPHLVIGSPLLDGPNPTFGEDGPVIAIRNPDHAREVVSQLQEQGFDFLKPYSLLPPASYRALMERADQLGMEVAGEIPITVSVREGAALGQRTVEHLTGVEFACSESEEELRARYRERLDNLTADPSSEDPVDIWYRSEWEPLATRDPERCEQLYEQLAREEVWVVPTLVVQRAISYFEDPELTGNPNFRYIDPWSRNLEGVANEFDPERRLRALYDARVESIDDLFRAGVGILAGSDTPGGFTLHEELEIFVESGLSPLDALRTATLAPARFLGREADLGSIAPGRFADLILLSANPLEDIRNTQRIESVVFQGHLLDRAHLDRMLEQLASDAENWPE